MTDWPTQGKQPDGTSDDRPGVAGPKWNSADRAAATAEGWDIFESRGSAHGSYQIQKFDDPVESGWPEKLLYPFTEDSDAWLHVKNRAQAGSELHQRALAFLARHNPLEHQAIQSFTPVNAGNSQ